MPLLSDLRQTPRWILVLLLCALGAAAAAFVLGWTGWVQSWIGAMFRAAAGAGLFWALARFVAKIDLSEIPPERRGYAGIALAILIGSGAIAVALGA